MSSPARGVSVLPLAAAAAAAALARPALPLARQQSAPPATGVLYRAPVLALAYPPPGGAVSASRPVIVFRFAPAEPDDPVDAASLAVSVDGVDRSACFQVAANEAWGSLAGGQPRDCRGTAIRPGVHVVTARICSARGICGSTTVAVTVLPPEGGREPDGPPTRLQRLGDLLLIALRKLLA